MDFRFAVNERIFVVLFKSPHYLESGYVVECLEMNKPAYTVILDSGVECMYFENEIEECPSDYDSDFYDED